MSWPVHIFIKESKEENQVKMKIVLMSVVEKKFKDMQEKITEGGNRRINN